MIPKRIELGQSMTPIYKLEKVSEILNKNIYIKREDFTGIEMSGNKVRKLEFALAEAIELGADTIITCGAIQSNHARATVAAATKLGLKTHLVLRGEKPTTFTGNLLIDTIYDAKCSFLSPLDFQDHVAFMEQLKVQYEKSGNLAYIIPIGASNGIGNFGYVNVFNEILEQEKKIGVEFDAISCAVGSGGTYSGLFLGNLLAKTTKKIIGYSVGGNRLDFESKCMHILEESLKYIQVENDVEHLLTSEALKIKRGEIYISDEYQGKGYAQTCEEDISFIKEIAKLEGFILDPVYTGKTFKGLYNDLANDKLSSSNHILYIHTGGIFGLAAYEQYFSNTDSKHK